MNIDDHTSLINIGYYLGTSAMPLAIERFELKTIEASVNPPDCSPDMIYHSNHHKETLILDAKGGKNLDDAQLTKFMQLTTEGLVSTILMPASEPRRSKCVMAYIAFEECKTRLNHGIKKCGFEGKIGLICLNRANGKICVDGSLPPDELKRKLANTTIEAPFPTQYYPFTSKSRGLEILHEVGVAILKLDDGSSISRSDIYTQVHPASQFMDVGGKGAIAKIINEALEFMRQEKLITIKENKIKLKTSQPEFSRKLQQKINEIQNNTSITDIPKIG